MKQSEHSQLQVTTLEGPVSVAFRRVGSEWHAIALQFDILGTGRTRGAAFGEMQELFQLYVTHVLSATGKVRFYNPSDKSDWEVKDKQHFHVTIVATKSAKPSAALEKPSLDHIEKLRRFRSQIRSISLQPA